MNLIDSNQSETEIRDDMVSIAIISNMAETFSTNYKLIGLLNQLDIWSWFRNTYRVVESNVDRHMNKMHCWVSLFSLNMFHLYLYHYCLNMKMANRSIIFSFSSWLYLVAHEIQWLEEFFLFIWEAGRQRQGETETASSHLLIFAPNAYMARAGPS